MTYPHPPDGWQCFHCGKRFARYKDAERHFGRTPKRLAACVEDVERIRSLNDALQMEVDLWRRQAGVEAA